MHLTSNKIVSNKRAKIDKEDRDLKMQQLRIATLHKQKCGLVPIASLFAELLLQTPEVDVKQLYKWRESSRCIALIHACLASCCSEYAVVLEKDILQRLFNSRNDR
jgi:hypothetical protein